jgi:type IV pilus assembly protein PilX
MHARFSQARRAAPAAQRGITLIIAMLMLVVIGLMSVGIMRNATSSDQVANNSRLQAQANQAAQMVLRFCEDQLAAGASGKVPPKDAPTPPAKPLWTVKTNWQAAPAGVAYTLQKTDIKGGDSNFPKVPPQCISEVSQDNTAVYTITARGFSSDYSAATNSGAIVWLQSTVYMP